MRQGKNKGTYRNNHYVPQWYQRRFMLPDQPHKVLSTLRLTPKKFTASDGSERTEQPERQLAAKRIFCQEDLYTTEMGDISNTEIEQYFFGQIDDSGKRAVDVLESFLDLKSDWPDIESLMVFLCTQRMRTPKGLAWLAKHTSTHKKVELLELLQRLQAVFSAIWLESIWQIADASESPTKFIVSDNPVTFYNRECPPGSALCGDIDEPDVRLAGTHTLFPLSLNKALILTNTCWVRDPYSSAQKTRPNPTLHRDAMFYYGSIQTGRMLAEEEVLQMNYIIKSRAGCMIAAAKSEWLYPEHRLGTPEWSTFGHGYLLMPDPREVMFSRGIMISYKDGSASGFDEYGRRPWEPDYKDETHASREYAGFHRFQGEYSRLFGKKLRGKRSEPSRTPSRNEVSEEYHQACLARERHAIENTPNT